ncbi:MAG: sulfatase-like hydrolase/transferase [Ardenticatenaceae bacterium]|nr:sulfatase-like hydrolase/transferase [Ardenticatenaceae bacterium]
MLILYTDQQRLDTLRCMGNPLAVSPNLDQLAQEGVRFSNYYVQNPICMPSRMSFLTGRYCASLGIGTNGIPFPEDAAALHTLVKPYGYHTAQLGKLHFDPHSRRDHRNPTSDYGFDTFILSDEPGCYDDAYTKWVEMVAPEQLPHVRTALPPEAEGMGLPNYSDTPRNTHEPYLFAADEQLSHTAFVASETCRFLEGIGDRPFLAIAGFYAPHPPINPPPRFVELFDPQQFPLPVRGPDEAPVPELAGFGAEEYRQMIAYYHALAAHVDDQIGRILQTLEQSGLSGRTLVIFTSDHGEFLGDHGRIQKGMPGFDCVTNVPLIMRFPGRLPQNRLIDSLVEGVDIVPTILEFCGVQIPEFVQGKSLKSLLEGQVQEHKESALIEFFQPFGRDRSATLKTARFTYHCAADGREALFDRDVDRHEIKDVAADPTYQEALGELRKLLIQRLQQAAFSARFKTAEY